MNQFYSLRNRVMASKHIFAGSTRLATRLIEIKGRERENYRPGKDGKRAPGSVEEALGGNIRLRGPVGNVTGRKSPGNSGSGTSTENVSSGNTSSSEGAENTPQETVSSDKGKGQVQGQSQGTGEDKSKDKGKDKEKGKDKDKDKDKDKGDDDHENFKQSP